MKNHKPYDLPFHSTYYLLPFLTSPLWPVGSSLVAQTGKESVCNAGDPGFIPGWERSPGEGTGNPLQYSCPKNLMDRGAWQATIHGITKSQHD